MADWCEVCGPEACSAYVQLPGSTPSHQPLLIGLLTRKLLCHQTDYTFLGRLKYGLLQMNVFKCI